MKYEVHSEAELRIVDADSYFDLHEAGAEWYIFTKDGEEVYRVRAAILNTIRPLD